MKDAVSQEVVAIERPGGAAFEDVRELVAGFTGGEALGNGDTDRGIWSAGMVQGLVHAIPSVKNLVDRLIAEVRAIIGERLGGRRVAEEALRPK